MATQVTTGGKGAFNFAGKTFKISSTSDTVIFILDDDGNVTGIKGLEGTVSANFEDAVTVNGNKVQVCGDKNSNVSVTATTSDGISEISGVNGDSVTIVSAGKADKISTSSSGSFIIGETAFEVSGDKNGVTFNLDKKGAVTSVESLDGTISTDFSNGLTVNENTVKVSGDSASVAASTSNGVTAISVSNNSEVTVSSAGGASKFSTDGDGKFTFGKKTFELLESSGANFELDETGAVTGVTNLKGSLALTATGTDFTVNKTSLIIGLDDFVTISTNSKGTISGVAGLDTYIEGLPGNTTIGVTDQNVTINGTGITINEGETTEYTLTLDKNAVPTQAAAFSNGVIVYRAPNMALVTEGNGNFRIGDRFYTITGADYGAAFQTDENSNVVGIDELGGGIAFKGDATLSVNGGEVQVDKVNSNGEIVTIFGGDGEIYNIYGLENGDTVAGDLTGAAISMPGSASSTVTLNVNENEYRLYGDSDGILIIPGKKSTAVKYISAGSNLVVSEAGTYLVTNDDGETFSIALSDTGTILVDEDGIASAYNENNFNLDKNSSVEKIINTISKQPDNYVNLDTPVKVYDSDINYNTNLVFDLDNKNSSSANYDFSSTSTRKRISLGSGDQNLTLSGAGDNIVVVKNTADGNKNIVLGSGGDNVVVDENSANVTIYAGKGSDDIVTKSDITVSTNNTGTAKVTALNNAVITFDSYGDEEYSKGTGIQTTLSKITKTIKTNSISFGDGTASIRGEGTIIFQTAASEEGFTKANFYDKTAYDGKNNSGSPTKVAFLHSAGGTLDLKKNTDDIVIKGNYISGNSGDQIKAANYQASILGGKADETILAGAGDTIDAGDGKNLIELSPDRTNAENSATIFISSKSANDTIKNFNFGTDSTADIIKTEKYALKDISITDDTAVVVSLKNAGKFTIDDAVGKTVLIENYYSELPTRYQFGNDRLTVNDVANYYWVGGSNATVAMGNYSADSLNIDLTYSEVDDSENLRFNGDIKAFDASNFSGVASITGNDKANIIIASSGNSTLFGGKGADTLTGGYSADVFLFSANHGNDLIKNFNFGTNIYSDKINTGALTLTGVTADEDNNVALKLSDGNLTVEGAVGNILQFENNYFGKTVTFQFGYDNILLSNIADYYWAGGSNATVSFGEYTAENTNINLKSTDFQDEENLGIYGDIQGIDAGDYEGTLNLTGNTKANSITLGSGAAVLNYASGDGNDTIYGWKENDTLKITGAAFSTIQSEEDILVCVGKSSIVLKDTAEFPLTIEGIIEGTSLTSTIVGTARDDTITNTVTAAVITALGANDSIFNKGNRVNIDAGNGKDTITNSGTNSTLNGGAGEDFITNTATGVTILGGSGYDTISGNGKNSSIHGGDGNDIISSTGETVTIVGGKGMDSISNNGNKVYITGNDGDDSIFSSGNNVTIEGNDGEDFISVSSASKNFVYQYRVGDDNDTIVGMKAGDTIKITGAKYSTVKSGKNLKINIDNNSILVRDGMDVDFKIAGISTEEETNLLKGTSNADILTNNKDLYTISGLGGADTITNSGSNVTIIGGTGNDIITNTGNGNLYQYASGDGNDIIYGFTSDDTIQITRGSVKTSLATGNDFVLNVGAGSVTFKGLSGDANINVMDTLGVVTSVKVGRLVQGTSKADTLNNTKDGYQIEAFAANDLITNSGSTVTITGGTGNDTITNSGSNVVYRYASGDGKDTIIGFGKTDTLKITNGKISNSVISGNDFILNIGVGSVTFKDIEADSNINIVNADGTDSVIKVPRLIQGTNKADTLTNDKDSYQINALAGNDTITNTGKLVTINAGTGNDTINISNREKSKTNNGNVILYANGDGKNYIYGFSDSDTLKITKGTVKSSVISGSDFVINVGSGSVIFKDAVGGSKVNLIGVDGKSSTLTIPKILQGTAKADTLTNSLKDYEIEGLAGNDTITNTAENVTIIGGKGNDTITNSVSSTSTKKTSSKASSKVTSKTVYQYAAGDGNDIIYGFSENDTLQITSGSVKSTLISGNDFVVNVSTGSITMKDTVGKKVNLLDSKGNLSSFTVPLMHVLTSKADYFINEDAGYFVDALAGSDTVENFAKNVTIDAGDGKDYIYNVGASTSIYGAAGNDSVDNFADSVTISGGAGNDTIINSGSKNLYRYASGEGNDIITGFSTNDTLQITKGNIKNTTAKGMDVIINVGSGSVTLEDAAGKNVNVVTAAGTLISTVYSGVWEGTAKADNYENSTGNLILKGLGGNDTIKNYAANVSINGGAGHDSITLDKSKNVTVVGGLGNDSITGNTSASVLYQYANGDGKDIITGFSKKDTLQITSGTVKSVTSSGGNTTIVVGSGSITLQKYTSGINLVDKNNSAINVNSNMWFAEDNNYITGEISIDTIMEDKFDVTNFETENNSTLAQDSTILTYGKEK